MKTYLDMDEILRHCRRYVGQEYDEPYVVSAVPEEVIRSLPLADVMEVRYGSWIVTSKLYPLPWDTDPLDWNRYDKKTHSEWEDFYECSECHKGEYDMKPKWHFCPNCGSKMDGDRE